MNSSGLDKNFREGFYFSWAQRTGWVTILTDGGKDAWEGRIGQVKAQRRDRCWEQQCFGKAGLKGEKRNGQ